jgi:hypothetical protein
MTMHHASPCELAFDLAKSEREREKEREMGRTRLRTCSSVFPVFSFIPQDDEESGEE